MATNKVSDLAKLDRPAMRVRLDETDRVIAQELNDAFLEMSGFERIDLDGQPLKDIEARDGQYPEGKLVSAIRNNLGGRYVFKARRPGDISYELCLTVIPKAFANGTNRTALV